MKIIISFAVATLCIFGGYVLLGGQLKLLAQPAEYVIILGGAAAAFYLGTSNKTIKLIGKVLRQSMSKDTTKEEYVEVMALMHDVISKMSREGMIAIETDVDNPAASPLFRRFPMASSDPEVMNFITDYLRMMITSKMTGQQLQMAMDDEILSRRKEFEKASAALYKVADALPAFGIMAAVMGVVHVMGSIGQVSNAELGFMIGGALVGTFIGVLFSYAYVGPLSQFVESRLNDSLKKLECIEAIFMAHIGHGFSAALSVEFGRKTLYSASRPTYAELEQRIRELRVGGAGSGGAGSTSASSIFQTQ
jgi:chemotaxis protein MotA